MGKWDGFDRYNKSSKWNKFPDDEEFEDEDDEDYDEDDEDEEDEIGYGNDWNYYSQHRPRKVAGGIKTKSERGAIGTTWWSKRWIQTLESFGMGTRLTRGRSYARQGQVRSIDIQSGVIKAKVQGSMPKPYNVTIELHPLNDTEWNLVADTMASQAIFAAKLLAGEMPTNIEEAFSTVKLSLFPTRLDDLRTNCTCPDWANPCKHIAAVYYILAEQFDEDPFLIFKLRGRTKEQLIALLREKRAGMTPQHDVQAVSLEEAIAPTEQLRLEDMFSTFWQAGDGLEQFTVRPRPPEVEKAILKRLGNAPLMAGKENLSRSLEHIYDVVQIAVQRKDMSEDV